MTNSEQRRFTNWRLKILQAATSAGNVARTCRYLGISRKTFYKWRQRDHEHGDTGLADRARAPHPLAAGHAGGGREQDPLPPAALPFRPWEDCRLSEPVSRPVGGVCLTASPTTSTCLTRSCGNGRTITITIALTAVWTVRRRTSDCARKRALKCYQGLRTLH